MPEFKGSEHVSTSNEMFQLDSLPERILVVGGGYIACEFAGIFSGMGCQVSQYYRGEQILRGFDRDIREHIAESIANHGISLSLGTNIKTVERTRRGLTAVTSDGESREFDLILYATGRKPSTKGLGLEKIGVNLGRNGSIMVDGYSQSSVPSIFAVGDVTDRVNLTPVAIREGAAFVRTVFEGVPTAADHENIPTAVFTRPEIGTVGMSEEEAALNSSIEVYCTRFRPLVNAMANKNDRVLMKLVVERNSGKVLGVHIVGDGAAEMIQLAGDFGKNGCYKKGFRPNGGCASNRRGRDRYVQTTGSRDLN